MRDLKIASQSAAKSRTDTTWKLQVDWPQVASYKLIGWLSQMPNVHVDIDVCWHSPVVMHRSIGIP